MKNQKFTQVSGATVPEDQATWTEHVDVALAAIEKSLQGKGMIQPQEQDVRCIQLQTASAANMALMAQHYTLKANVRHWDEWEDRLCPGFSSEWHDVLTSKRFELKFERQLKMTTPTAWCFKLQQTESWWFVGSQQYLFQMLKTGSGTAIELHKVTGLTVDRPLVGKTFEVGDKEKVTGSDPNQFLGDMTLVSGLFHQARSGKLIRTEPMKQ